jgi:hypothetical protein
LAALCLSFTGCAQQEGRTLALDEDVAKDACVEFLDAWKGGGNRADLEPDIYGRDVSWDAGDKLLNYEILPDEKDGGSNLHIPVRLTLKSKQGRESKVDVVYIVGTTPKVSVFRDSND